MMSALRSKVMREKQDDDNDQEYPDQPVARATKPLSIKVKSVRLKARWTKWREDRAASLV
jgi:hypothetical protein